MGEVKVKKKILGIFPGKISPEKTFGEISEEYILTNTWEELMKNVPIIDPHKFLLDLEASKLSWIWSVFGCHLVKNLIRPRYSLKMVTFLIRKFTKVQGEFLEEETQIVLDHIAIHTKPNYKYLAEMLNRTEVNVRLKAANLLDHARAVIKKGVFSLDEDIQIMKSAFDKIPQNFDEFKASDDKGYTKASEVLRRPTRSILGRWDKFIKPTHIRKN